MKSGNGRSSEGASASGRIGLRVDVCTYQGMREGVPRLLEIFARHRVRATFFPTLGPDRSGRAVWRVFRKPGFLSKMLRTGGLSMYGWRTALYGTLLPSPRIGEKCAGTLRRIVTEGHELGVHAWDHVTWQDGLDGLTASWIAEDYRRAVEACGALSGEEPRATAAPAWLSSTASLLAAEDRGFEYASDTRGRGPFRPYVEGRPLRLPQVPATLPTLDEVLGLRGQSMDESTGGLADLVLDAAGRAERTDVFNVHAEAEGRSYSGFLERLLERLLAEGIDVVPLGRLLELTPGPLPVCRVERREVTGRAGRVSIQGDEVPGSDPDATGDQASAENQSAERQES